MRFSPPDRIIVAFPTSGVRDRRSLRRRGGVYRAGEIKRDVCRANRRRQRDLLRRRRFRHLEISRGSAAVPKNRAAV